ncbi:MAG: hypothetical protein RMJ31_07355, partial [Nitrososphaerota archaeon]|nr:hypothetical protein [Nitrososphaerota archaeon]
MLIRDFHQSKHIKRLLISLIFLLLLTLISFPQTQLFNHSIDSIKVEGAVNYNLVLYSTPPKIPADGKSYPCIVIQIQNEDGLPAPAPEDVLITLSSSNPSVGNVQGSIVIMKGENYAIANFTSTKIAGSTTITASAQGYKTGSIEIETVTLTTHPKSLAVYLSPSQILARSGSQGIIIVQLEDTN